VVFNGVWYKADFQGVDYYPTTSAVTSQQLNVYLPDSARHDKPVNGWPVHIVTRMTDYITTDDVAASDTLDQIVGGPSVSAARPPFFPTTTKPLEPQLYSLLDKGSAVVLVDVRGPWSDTDTLTSGDGDGIVHPPGKVSTADGGQHPVGTDAWADDDLPNCFKEFVWALQYVLYNASTYDLDNTRWTVGGSAGCSLGDGGGGAGSTIAGWVVASPDWADPTQTDFRQQSTSGCKGVYYSHGLAHIPMYETAAGAGSMGESVDAGYGDFMFLADTTLPASELADVFGDTDIGDRFAMSLFHVLGKDAEARERNASGPPFYIYQASSSSTSLGTDLAGVNVILDGDEGADTSTTSVYPKLVKTGTSTETTLDAAESVAAARKLNRRSPLMGYALMRRLTQIESALFHTTNSRLVVDQNTRTAAASLLAATYTDLEETTVQEATSVTDRITAEVEWILARLAKPAVIAKPGLTVQDCVGHIKHALGGNLAAELSPLRIINEAGRRLVAAHGWRYLQGRTTTLDTVSGQNYVVLPEDFQRLISIYMTDSLVKKVTVSSMDELIQMRTTTIAISNLNYWVAIVHEQEDPGIGAQTPRLEIWPTPDADEEGIITLFYRAGWAEMRLDSDCLSIPRFIEPLYIEILRAVAEGYERPGMVGHITELVGRVLAGPTMKGCIRQDSQIQYTVGALRGGAVEGFEDEWITPGTWGYLVQGPG
jgi:hypothetical protein